MEFVLEPVKAVKIVKAASVGVDPGEEETDYFGSVGVFGSGVGGKWHHAHREEGVVFAGKGEGGFMHQKVYGAVGSLGMAGELLGQPAVSSGDWAEGEEAHGFAVLDGDKGSAIFEEGEGLGFNEEGERRESAAL